VRACAHSKILGFIYLCRLFALFVTCSVVSFCCSFLLGLSQTFLTFNTPCARCYFFFSHKRNTLSLGNRFPHKHTYTPKKRKTILEFLLHDIPSLPSLSPSFGLFFYLFHLFLFWLFSYPLFFTIFKLRKKENLPNLSPLFSFRGLQLPPHQTDT